VAYEHLVTLKGIVPRTGVRTTTPELVGSHVIAVRPDAYMWIISKEVLVWAGCRKVIAVIAAGRVGCGGYSEALMALRGVGGVRKYELREQPPIREGIV